MLGRNSKVEDGRRTISDFDRLENLQRLVHSVNSRLERLEKRQPPTTESAHRLIEAAKVAGRIEEKSRNYETREAWPAYIRELVEAFEGLGW